jgi:four helix bundle protein
LVTITRGARARSNGRDGRDEGGGMRDECRSTGSAKANQGLCAADRKALRRSSKRCSSSDSWEANSSIWNFSSAQYREACRAKSNADFVNKIEGALQELDETQYWIELIAETNLVKAERLSALQKETEELIAMFVTMVKGVKEKTRMLKKKGVIPHPSALIP